MCPTLHPVSVQKEILLRVLHYIHYLQRCIDVVQALLKLHNSDSKGGFVGKQFHLQLTLYHRVSWLSGKLIDCLLLPGEGDYNREVSKVLQESLM